MNVMNLHEPSNEGSCQKKVPLADIVASE